MNIPLFRRGLWISLDERLCDDDERIVASLDEARNNVALKNSQDKIALQCHIRQALFFDVCHLIKASGLTPISNDVAFYMLLYVTRSVKMIPSYETNSPFLDHSV